MRATGFKPKAVATAPATPSKIRTASRVTPYTRRASTASAVSSAAMVGIATPTVTTATTMAAATPGGVIPAAVAPLVTAVAVPLFCAAELLLCLLWGWPPHRCLGSIVGPSEGGHQVEGWCRLLLPEPGAVVHVGLRLSYGQDLRRMKPRPPDGRQESGGYIDDRCPQLGRKFYPSRRGHV